MAFDYQARTKQHYQSADVAQAYHAAFAEDTSWRNLPSRVVAARERKVVGQLLLRVPNARVLDLPAGTGKLAPVFQRLGATVVACDISPAMLEIARREYARAGCREVQFQVCDAERIGATLGARFDVAVCLRLLHRVPTAVRAGILKELAACADHTIVSMGIETAYHRLRRQVRYRLLGGERAAFCYADPAAARAQLTEHFEILAARWTLPWLAQEMIFLARPRRA